MLCENNIYSQGHMNDTLTHELIHTLDYCRAELDWNNIHHLACTEIRAASLSGECFFWKENFARLKFGWKKHHQVRREGGEGEEEKGEREGEERIITHLSFVFSTHQACVRERATKSILCVRDVTEEEAKRAVDKVFESCFRDTYPFERVPP